MSMEDIDEDMGMGYNESLRNSARVRVLSPVEETPTMVVRNNNNIVNNNVNIMKATYRECLKNHAISYGGHALDGCYEFLPAGPEGSLEALKCAACNCHRNFHRREAPLPPNDVTVAAPVPATIIPARDAHPPYNQHCYQTAPPSQYTVYHLPKGLLHVTAPPSGGGPSALALISSVGGGAGGEDQDDAMVTDNGGIGSSSNSKKRFRTKFTPEQKEKMKAFAERLDWRIRKQDDVVVQEFCNENGVKRQVLKVWMHNKKYTIGSANAGSDAMKFEDEDFVWWLKFIASASISGS